jgi:pimeloyl-ACP methyl ester carboxylesterase
VDIKPFRIAIEDDEIADLRHRLAATRWPDAIEGMNWQEGTDLAFLQRLTSYWQTGFDWRSQEAVLNVLPQFTADLDGLNVHFIHQRGVGPDPCPLLITHGWPGTGFDMARIIALLTDPGGHGADPADAFDVVAPSIPGYGFSDRPHKTGFGPHHVAEMWMRLMTGLGYDRFAVQGGDWGAAISIWLAYRFPDLVTALHLNFIPGNYQPPLGDGQPPLTDEENAFREKSAAWFNTEGGYHRLQSTKPQTPSYALTDSPAGLAAWIVEKYRNWSDCDGDVERAFTLDTILTDVSLYWFTATIGSSMRFYREDRLRPLHFTSGERVSTPLGVARFPRDTMPPRSWVQRVFDVRRWSELPHGAHLGPQEAPESLAEEIRAFFRPFRKARAA